MTAPLPGQVRVIRPGDECPCQYDECTAPATHEYCTEADSFDADWLPLCEAHVESFKKDVSDARAPYISHCDWCKTPGVPTAPFRDYEEGTHGPVYDVCEVCRGKSIDRANEEANTGMDDEEEHHQMPELDSETLARIFSDEEEDPYPSYEYNDPQYTSMFNISGPRLEKGQLGFSAHWPDGLHMVLCLDLQESILFWRPMNYLECSFVDPARITLAVNRIKAMGYDVAQYEEL